MNAKAGRPAADNATRQQLLCQARLLFAELGYERVTTRMIAQAAGVNAGMIRYYFVDKAGLFEAMLRETIAPLLQLAQQQVQMAQLRDPAAVVAAYYAVMAPHPLLPRLIFRALHNIHSAEYQIVSRVFAGFVQQMLHNMQQVLQTPDLLQPGLQPFNALITCFSLAIFPFVIPPFMQQALKLDLTPEFLQQLAVHQRQVLEHGLLQKGLVDNKRNRSEPQPAVFTDTGTQHE
jgi:AcrR family transcriptional regulator